VAALACFMAKAYSPADRGGNMAAFDLDHAVQALLEARRSGVQVAPPFALPDRAAVYAIQDGVAKATGPVSGWKVGARTPTAEPNPAPLLAGALVKSPARFDGKAISIDVELSKERNPRQSERCDRIEITLSAYGEQNRKIAIH